MASVPVVDFAEEAGVDVAEDACVDVDEDTGFDVARGANGASEDVSELGILPSPTLPVLMEP